MMSIWAISVQWIEQLEYWASEFISNFSMLLNSKEKLLAQLLAHCSSLVLGKVSSKSR